MLLKFRPVWRVDDEYDALALFVVVLPEVAVAPLSGHVESRKADITVYKQKFVELIIKQEGQSKVNVVKCYGTP